MLLTALVTAGVLSACGADHRTPAQRLTDCMRGHAGARDTEKISLRPPGVSPRDPAATTAIKYSVGGPRKEGSAIIDAPIDTEAIYVFADASAAQRAAKQTAPAIARQETTKTSATPIGRAMLVYIAGGQLSATTFPISPEALAAARQCVHGAGYS